MTTAALRIVKPGLLTTVQDEGRWGRQAFGVPVGGPMDPYAHRLANRIVGNLRTAAALEITLVGPDIEVEGDIVFAVTGAEFEVSVDGVPSPRNAACTARSGSRLRFGRRDAGARACLAVAGGIATTPAFGSRATSLSSRMGGHEGRALISGDWLSIGAEVQSAAVLGRPRPPLGAPPLGGARLRVMLGPQQDRFTPAALDVLQTARYTISGASNRMGFRLEGARLEHARGADVISDATPLGVLQVPASGQPILLMADRQTTGGYPKIATVITADLTIAGQLAPGDWIEFQVCDRREAMAALLRQEQSLL